LVTPVLVLVGWVTSRPLTLDFNTLEICVLACAVLIVNYLVADGKANWLEGYMLIVSIIIIYDLWIEKKKRKNVTKKMYIYNYLIIFCRFLILLLRLHSSISPMYLNLKKT